MQKASGEKFKRPLHSYLYADGGKWAEQHWDGTYGSAATATLLDHLGGAGEQREREVQLRAERVDRGQRGHIATIHYISLPCSHQKPISISRYIVVAAVKFSWACSGLPVRR